MSLLQQACSNLNTKMSVQKTKYFAFLGKTPLRNYIVLDKNRDAITFLLSGSEIRSNVVYEADKIFKVLSISGTISQAFLQ